MYIYLSKADLRSRLDPHVEWGYLFASGRGLVAGVGLVDVVLDNYGQVRNLRVK